MEEVNNTVGDAFSFEISSRDRLSVNINERAYVTLKSRLKLCETAEELLQRELLNFTCYVVGNIEWYHQRLKKETTIRGIWFVVSALMTLALPLIVYFFDSKLNPSGFSSATAILASILALHRITNSYFEKSRVITGYRSAASALKELLYEFENKWADVLNSPSRARIFEEDCRADIRSIVIEARKVVAQEKLEFFENSKPPLISMPEHLVSSNRRNMRTEFLSDELSQPAANFLFIGFSAEEEDKVLAAHLFAYQTIAGCIHMTEEEKSELKAVYSKKIVHHKIVGNDLGQADLNGNFIGVNLEKLLGSSISSNELPQTLIHEMMHCAGFGHRPKDSSDMPGDGGEYFGSPPLRAELCIAGLQSDVHGNAESTSSTSFCSLDPSNGKFILR